MTPTQEDILDTLANAFEEDPTPHAGRTYWKDEEEYAIAYDLVDQGLAFVVTWGIFQNRRWVHFGITDEGLEA